MLTPDRRDDRPAERSRMRPCVHCGASFQPSRKHQRHCRPTCRVAAFEARRALKQRALFPELLEDALMRVEIE